MTSDDAPPGWLRRNARLLVILLAILGVAGFVIVRRFRPIPVTTTPVVRGKAVDAVYATGTVEAEDRVVVKAKTSGSVAEILVKEGAAVKKGELLARVDNPTISFDLKRGQVDLAAASAQAGKNAPQIVALEMQAKALSAELENAKQDLARTSALAKSGAVTTSELDRAQARAAQLEATIAANGAQQQALRIDLTAKAAGSQANVQSLASRLADTEVRAPLDGVVLTKSVEVGEVVAVNQPLFKVGDLRSLILEVSVDEADVSRVRAGPGETGSPCAVSLYAFAKEIFRGRIFEVLPDANRERKAFLAKVRLAKPPEGLRSGMSAEVNIIALEKDGALLAPSEAESAGAVWLLEGGRAHRRAVRVGIRDLLRVEVTEGLAEGDHVVVEGQDKLTEGARVSETVKAADKNAAMPDRSQPGQTALK